MKKTLRERSNEARVSIKLSKRVTNFFNNKKGLSEGYTSRYQIPKSTLERGLSNEWSNLVKGSKFECEVIGNYDIDDFHVVAYGDELGVYKLYYELNRSFTKFLNSVITIDIGYSKNEKSHYLMFRNYGELSL